jgi:hypothetical protein
MFVLGMVAFGLQCSVATVRPPAVAVQTERVYEERGVRFSGPAFTDMRAGVREAYLEGSAEELGARHVRLLGERMAIDENGLWNRFDHILPVEALRTLLIDFGRTRYRSVEQYLPDARRRELAAEAIAIQPDSNAHRIPSYERLVLLHAVYDVALSLQQSTLLGCSAFGLGPRATKNGHVIVGRTFDMEAGDVFDSDKVVYFVREDGMIPYASVAWPGLTGVITGMNLDGVMMIVNGARAGEAKTAGLPVVFSLREALQRAHDTDEAVAVLARQDIMVAHIVFVADRKGQFAVVERTPNRPQFVRRDFADRDRVAVTNHLEGTSKDDPKNIAVREHTTSLARRARLDEMLGDVKPRSADVDSAAAMLRDHHCAGGVVCPLGDRRSIDALIATHGVIADVTDRVLWVSKGPHLSGELVRFDLKEVFAAGHDPRSADQPDVIPEDPILSDGRFAEGQEHAAATRGRE